MMVVEEEAGKGDEARGRKGMSCGEYRVIKLQYVYTH
jgi:hypothetical protein